MLNAATGLSEDKPYLDPCLPLALPHTLVRDNRTVHLRGQGDWARCLDAVQPFLGLHNGTMTAGGVYQVPRRPCNFFFFWMENGRWQCAVGLWYSIKMSTLNRTMSK